MRRLQTFGDHGFYDVPLCANLPLNLAAGGGKGPGDGGRDERATGGSGRRLLQPRG